MLFTFICEKSIESDDFLNKFVSLALSDTVLNSDKLFLNEFKGGVFLTFVSLSLKRCLA